MMMRSVFFFMIFMGWLPPVLHAAGPLPEFYYYDVSEVPGPRGSIVRSEEVTARLQGARGYRVLYRTTTFGGAPIIASTLLFVPEGQEAKPLGTAVWAHRTVGIRARCAPSILDDAADLENLKYTSVKSKLEEARKRSKIHAMPHLVAPAVRSGLI